MADAQEGRTQRLDEVLKLVREKVAPEKRDVLERFVKRYFSQLDPEDLAERQPADLYGAALSHWNFARKRDPGSAGQQQSSVRDGSEHRVEAVLSSCDEGFQGGKDQTLIGIISMIGRSDIATDATGHCPQRSSLFLP